MTSKIFNLILRSITLGSKFFLLVFLAKYLTPSQLGIFGLVAATISYSVFFIGFDFYTYSTRELLKTNRDKWFSMLRDQGVFYVTCYFLLMPFLVLIFWFGILSWKYFILFILLLLLEHLAQELNRIFIVMSEQLFASIILFVRSGLWCFLVVPLLMLMPEYRTVETVLIAWVAGASTSCLLALLKLRWLDSSTLSNNVDWVWIRAGLRIALPMLCATLAIKGIFTIDRYIVKATASPDVLGAYTLFMSIANSFVSFLDAGVIVFFYPKLVMLAHNKNYPEFNRNMKYVACQSLVILLFLTLCVMVFINPLLSWIGKSVYSNNLNMFYIIVCAINLFSISFVPQLGLYAFRKDSAIIASHISGLIVFLMLMRLLYDTQGPMTVPWSLCGACLIILLIKTGAFIVFRKTSII